MLADALRPVYLLRGSDRPKVRRALGRLRARFPDESVDVLAAETASGEDAVAACNALALFGVDGGRLVVVEGAESWKKDDVEAVAAYLAAPTPGAVLALVAEGAVKEARLVEVCARTGQVLVYDVPKPKDPSVWVRSEFDRLGVRVEPEAPRALVEIAGDDIAALATEVEKIATWAGKERVTRSVVEALAVPAHDAAAWALSDAWGARDVAALVRTCEAELEEREPFVIAVRLASHVGLVRTVQALAEEGLAQREIAKRLRMHEFRIRKALGHAENYTRDELDEAIVRVAALDAAVKGASALAAELELERALVEMTQTAVAAGER